LWFGFVPNKTKAKGNANADEEVGNFDEDWAGDFDFLNPVVNLFLFSLGTDGDFHFAFTFPDPSQ
jgi:hypothetical protein